LLTADFTAVLVIDSLKAHAPDALVTKKQHGAKFVPAIWDIVMQAAPIVKNSPTQWNAKNLTTSYPKSLHLSLNPTEPHVST
jgi:hypothetical protein